MDEVAGSEIRQTFSDVNRAATEMDPGRFQPPVAQPQKPLTVTNPFFQPTAPGSPPAAPHSSSRPAGLALTQSERPASTDFLPPEPPVFENPSRSSEPVPLTPDATVQDQSWESLPRFTVTS